MPADLPAVMMKSILPALSKILCHPESGLSVGLESDHFLAENGERFPIMDDIAIFLPGHLPFRHRFWEWVYNRTAFSYDFGVRYAWRLPVGGAPLSRSSYLDALSIKPGGRTLETAVGTGDNLLQLPLDSFYVGLDLSFRMLQRCRRKLAQAGRPAALVQADMANLPFFEKTFDNVLHVGGLQFLHDPCAGIREMHRVAREGAEVTIVDESASLKRLLRRAGVERLEEIAPQATENVRAEIISDGELYSVKFIRT